MPQVVALPVASWDAPCPASVQDLALRALEAGEVVALGALAFALDAGERSLLSPAVSGDGKNVSLDADGARLRGTSAQDGERRALQAMMQRFAEASTMLVRNLAPRYAAHLQRGRTSFRPVEITGRAVSWRKDDTRLHVDSFPSSPVQGRRILRVFANINPDGKSRTWRLGESFAAVAQRYDSSLRLPLAGAGRALEWLHVTRGRRTPYDHLMLQLHDRMKADREYQSDAIQIRHEFGPGSTWLLFSDQVPHAAMAGQHALEQTFYLPVAAMLDPRRSPLSTLERLRGRALT